MARIRMMDRTWTPEDIKRACRLYLVTDERWLDGRTLHSCVAEAIVGGATFVQLRDKDDRTVDLTRHARDLIPVCKVANVPLVINDDIEAAKASGADGLHIGPNDLTCKEVRAELGADAIVGVTVRNVEEALDAQAQGASYVSTGPMFASAGKDPKELISISTLRHISDAVEIPVVAVGGINSCNVPELARTGIAGVATVSAVLAASNIENAARELSREVDQYILGE